MALKTCITNRVISWHKSRPFNTKVSKSKFRLIPPVGFIQRVAVIDKEIEILGIKFKNGFNIDVPYDILHTNPVRFLEDYFSSGGRESTWNSDLKTESRFLGTKCK